ncbi:MAG: membrane-bound lytic murein transglycosylase MltF [Halioglobus sp.]|nr:membrane-bound lytic murein transglycosylase MltF [Halioglobus sp.]
MHVAAAATLALVNARNLNLLLLLAVLLAGCTRQDSLDEILSGGELHVVSRNSPSTYYLTRSGPAGFEYTLAGLLAEELGVALVMEPAFGLREIFSRLRRGEVHLAAAGLTLTTRRDARFPHSIPYASVVTQVIYKAGNFRPRGIHDLPGMDIVTLAGSSHAEALRTLRDTALEDLAWREIGEGDTMDLLAMVRQGKAQLALIDSTEFAVQQSLFPRLKVAFDLGAEEEIVWYLPPGRDHARLLARINALLQRLEQEGTLAQLREQHFGHVAGISRIGSHTFNLNMQRDLPPYRELIQQVAGEYQIDWRLLAAIAYQESHWNPLAASPTGVRGMMMLTLPTAREMGVDNRLDAGQSLRGGARYYKNIKRRLPPDIVEPDRTWMALAAYNIGMGHLEDARVLTERQGGDPHLWRDIMERLPLLQQSKFYKTLRYGYARGTEAVNYVQNIRHYYRILQWQDIPGNNARPPLRSEEYLPEPVRDLNLQAL